MTSIVRIKKLKKSFGNTVALHDVEFDVAKGEIFGIVGKSGSGKSTLMRLLIGLDKPTSGEIVFDGPKKIGMIFQHFNLLSSRTALENVMLPLEISGAPNRKEKAYELLELVSLRHKADHYPSTLSGGEKQRVAIARALANDPEILLSDEGTSALDPVSTQSILQLLVRLNRSLGITIILITHEMKVVKQICTKMAVLSEGKIVEQGEVSDLFATPHSAATKELLQDLTHEIPPSFDKTRKLVRLTFKGKSAGEPIISHLIKKHEIEVNILLGGIDVLQRETIGSLVVEMKGSEEEVLKAHNFLKQNGVILEPF